MAATIKVYGKAGIHLRNGDIAWDTDTIKLSLHTSSYTVDQGANEFYTDLTNELTTAGGYTVGGFALAGMSRTYDATTREERFLANNFSVAALTPSSPFRYGVIRKDTGTGSTSILIAYINFGADQNPAGLPFAIQWASTGVWYTQAV